jgi:hypothetical protein
VNSTIPHSGGFNTPQLVAEPVSKACFGGHTRDFYILSFFKKILNSFLGYSLHQIVI